MVNNRTPSIRHSLEHRCALNRRLFTTVLARFVSTLLNSNYYAFTMYGQSGSNDFRRKWDLSEYERKVQDRIASNKKNKDGSVAEDEEEKATKEPPKKREMLKPREFKVDLESKLGKTVVISKATPSNQAGGFYCDVCDCVVKDSINYLDHINGKKHQRNLGMSMKVKKSTLEDVKARFELKLKEKDKKKTEYDLEERIKELKEEEEKLKEYRKEQKRNKKQKRKEVEEDGDDDDQMAALMGFGSFGSKKKK